MEKNQTVLIVDDEKDVCELLADYLEKQGYRTVKAHNGREGLKLFKERQPSLMLLDLMMPDIDGFDVLSMVREWDDEFPIIVVSGTGRVGDAIRALRLGAWDFILKPLPELEILRVTVERAIEKYELLEENRRYRDHLEEQIEIRTRELKERTIELVEANIQLKNEIVERRRAEEEVRQLNDELELRVKKRTEELKATLEKLQEDEEAGRKIQNRLLPSPKKNCLNYYFCSRLIPSMYLSGDFVDYFTINDEYVGFYIADVSGHGASSAFITVLLKSFMNQALRNFRMINDSLLLQPHLVLTRLNEEILREDVGKHLTLFYGIIHAPTNTMVFSTGGQYPFPVIVTEQKIAFIREKGVPVGMFDFSEYHDVEIALPDTFNMVFISDGVLEIMEGDNLKDKENQLLEIFNNLDMDVDDLKKGFHFPPGSDMPDDVTFMMIKRRP